jgi:hypothetical protein
MKKKVIHFSRTALPEIPCLKKIKMGCMACLTLTLLNVSVMSVHADMPTQYAAPVPAPALMPAPAIVPSSAPPTNSDPLLTGTVAPQASTTTSLDAAVSDIPATFTFRASCIKKSYKDSVYGDLIEPTLVKNGTDDTYTLHTTCLNGVGIPMLGSTIAMKLVVRYLNNARTISIRSWINGKLRNCADIANANGKLICVPPTKTK